MPLSHLEGATYVTANFQSARWLLYKFNQKYKQTGKNSWPTPNIFTLSSWLKQIWVQSWPDRFILSRTQSQKLWESIIKNFSPDHFFQVISLNGIICQAGQAYRYFHQYNFPESHRSFQWTVETKAFLHWKNIYEDQLREWKAIDEDFLINEILNGMRSQRISLPENQVFLIGFYQLSPKFREWLDFLNFRKVSITFLPDQLKDEKNKKNGKTIEVLDFRDIREESRACARWTIEMNRNQKTVGIIVPDINQYKVPLKNELSNEMGSGLIYPWFQKEFPVSIPGDNALNNEPAIQLAHTLLNQKEILISEVTFSAILDSPFLNLELKLPENKSKLSKNNFFLSLKDYSNNPEISWSLKFFLNNWIALITNNHLQYPSQWAYDFSKFLFDIKWPSGKSHMPNHLKRLVEAWTLCLDELSSLGKILGQIDRKTALNELRQIIDCKSVDDDSKIKPIQIISWEDAPGMEFDFLWVLNGTSDSIPKPPNTNPFLPIPLQKKLNTPHSSSELENEQSKLILKQLKKSSPVICFSYPKLSNNIETIVSPLLKEFLEDHKNGLKSKIESIGKTPAKIPRLELFADSSILPFLPSEKIEWRTQFSKFGYRILNDESDCPFRAFAKFRLDIQSDLNAETDFEPSHRGNAVHKAMEIFWSDVKNQFELKRLSQSGQLIQKIDKVSKQAVKYLFLELGINGQNRFAELESQRIKELVSRWLDYEMQRSSFDVVSIEKSATVKIGDLSLRIRIDRMDLVENRHHLLIDYKTGNCNPRDWFQERIRETQLPIYALAYKPDAVAYASLKKNEKSTGLKAIQKDSSIIKGVKWIDYSKETGCNTWDELLEFWKENLTRLANRFFNGQIELDPYKKTETCKYCGLQTFCRIDSASDERADTED